MIWSGFLLTPRSSPATWASSAINSNAEIRTDRKNCRTVAGIMDVEWMYETARANGAAGHIKKRIQFTSVE